MAIEFKGYEASVEDDIDDQGKPVQSFDDVFRLDADYVHQIRAGGNQKPTPLLNLESLNG